MQAYQNAEHLEQAAKAHINEHGMVHIVSLDQLASFHVKMKALKRVLLAV